MNNKNEYIPQTRPHPGLTLAEKLAELNMGSKEFALRTNKPEKTISEVLGGKSAITPDMAIQFENVTKIPAHFWLNHQRSFDEFIARKKQTALVAQANTWAKQFPVKKMMDLGWLPNLENTKNAAAALLAYFGFASHTAWENFYLNQQLKVVFRISLANTKNPYAISAFLRHGELEANKLPTNIYTEANFKEILPQLKHIMYKHPKDFFKQIQEVCLAVGVKVVHTPLLTQAPISGSTRWLGDTPLIQLTGRYKRNDSFWFTLFHEIGHILLHGKKDIFLEKVDYNEADLQKETEADNFAADFILTHLHEAEILANAPLDERKILHFAKKFTTHPAMIVGRLQYKKQIHYSVGRGYFEEVVLGDRVN
jgi:HTH-type transcriptional regulator / antitoxin HigA